MSNAKGWCFTYNNYSAEEENNLVDDLRSEANYYIIGHEKGEEGTPHLQGYCEFKKRVRLSFLKNLSKRIHWEVRRGKQMQAIEYCKKDNSWMEWGTRAVQGSRSDLSAALESFEDGGMRLVAASHKLHGIKHAEKYAEYCEKPRSEKPTVVWLWGETGTGKSRYARYVTRFMDTYVHNCGTKWFPGYDGHEAVIFDDFDDNVFPFSYFLTLLDRYSALVEPKGGYRQFKASYIVVTSHLPPSTYYAAKGNDQMLRRIDNILEMKKDTFDWDALEAEDKLESPPP